MLANGHGHFLFAQISHPNYHLEQENKERNLTIVGAAPMRCRLHHRLLEVVVDLDESMAGLHFSLCVKVSANC